MIYTNNYDLSLSVAVWLAADDYDHSSKPNEISATGLLKPIRQLVLLARANATSPVDITSNVASSIGTAIHSDIYNAWMHNRKQALTDLGYLPEDIERIVINPSPEELTENVLPIYMENRVKKTIGNWVVSGKYDFVGNGQLEDFKSTGVYSYIKQNKINDYIVQGSIYRWLNPEIITEDTIKIQYIFLNWEAFKVNQTGYPAYKMLAEEYTLMSLEDTEQFIVDKLALLDQLKDTPEPELPLCTAKELWQTNTTYKYYKNPAKMSRSTANFDDYYKAHDRLLKDGNIGVIVEKPGMVKACAFCGVSSMCTQKDSYIANGTLII